MHCIAGVSRSVTLVLAHLMLRHQLCLRDAYAHVHNCRPIVCPNKGFKVALAQLEVRDHMMGACILELEDCIVICSFTMVVACGRISMCILSSLHQSCRLYQLTK